MKKRKKYFYVLIAVTLSITLECKAQSPVSDPNWTLQSSLSDDFSGTTLDASKWQALNCGDPGVYAWGGADGYASSSDTLYGGILHLRTYNTQCCYPNCYKTGGIWSVSGGTSHEAYQYGYLEIYAQLPGFIDGSGVAHGDKFHPAFWTFHDDPGSGGCYMAHDEIDILEPGASQYVNANANFCGLWNETTYTSDPHQSIPGWTYYDPPSPSTCPYGRYKIQSSYISSTPLCSAYHKYAIEWNPYRMTYYMDDNPFFVIQDQAGCTEHLSRVVINSALDPGYSFYPGSFNSSNNYQQTMNIDYFHYYKLILDCSTSVTMLNNTDLAGFAWGVKSSITFGNNANSISLSSGDHKIFRAVSSITINGNFTVPMGAEFAAIPTPCN